MLPARHSLLYQTFQDHLNTLQQSWFTSTLTACNHAIAQLSHQLQTQLVPLDRTELPADIAHTLQSYHTEIHKQLQLLKVDIAFWFAARQPQKRSERQEQIQTRFHTLARYLEAIQNQSADP